MNANHSSGEHAAARGGRKKLVLLLAAFLVLVLVFSLGAAGAFASLKDTASPVTVNFTPVKVDCAVNKDYSVKNTGEIPVLIRAKVVVNWIDRDGNVVANAGELPKLTVSAGWQQINGFLYYSGVINAGESTAPVIASLGKVDAPEGLKLQTVVLAEAIQAEPNGEAAGEAWGVTYKNGSWGAQKPAG